MPALVGLLSWGALSFGAVYPWGYVPLLVGCAELGLYGLLRWQAFSGVPGVLVASLGAIAVAISLQLVPLQPRVLAWVSPGTETVVANAGLVAVAPGGGVAVAAALRDQSSAVRPLSTRSQGTAAGLTFFVVFALFFLGCVRALGLVGVHGLARGMIGLDAAPSSYSPARDR